MTVVEHKMVDRSSSIGFLALYNDRQGGDKIVIIYYERDSSTADKDDRSMKYDDTVWLTSFYLICV